MSPRVKALLDAYPTIIHAVSWVELMVCGKEDGETESAWDVMMNAPTPCEPHEVAEMIRSTIDEEEIANVPRAALAREEMERPEFLDYVKGKMGAV